MHAIPLKYLPIVKSWAESAKSSQTPFEVDITNPECVYVKHKEKAPRSSYNGGHFLTIHAESPTLAALGDALYAKLRPEVPVKPKYAKTSGQKSPQAVALEKLGKIVSRESRWALHAMLMSDKPGRKALSGEMPYISAIEPAEEPIALKDRMSKKNAMHIMRDQLQPQIVKEKISVVGLYIQASELGDKTFMEFPFVGAVLGKKSAVVAEAVKEEPVKEEPVKEEAVEEESVTEEAVEDKVVEEAAVTEEATKDEAAIEKSI